MKKFFENKPRAVFIIGSSFILLVVLISVSLLYYERSKNKEDDTNKYLYNATTEEIEVAKNKLSDSGDVVSITKTNLIINSETNNQVTTYLLTDQTTIDKGIELKTGNLQELTVGKVVSVGYKADSKEVINIWYEE